MTIGLVAALPEELRPILAGRGAEERLLRGRRYFLFSAGGASIVAAPTGAGKVSAAVATACLILDFRVDLILNVGVCGGFGDAKPLDLVAVSKSVQADVDLSAFGAPLGLASGMDAPFFDSDPVILRALVSKLGFRPAIAATFDRFVRSPADRDFAISAFGASVCDMEIGAVAHAARLFGLPYVSLKCVSDDAGVGAEAAFESALGRASARLAERFDAAVALIASSSG